MTGCRAAGGQIQRRVTTAPKQVVMLCLQDAPPTITPLFCGLRHLIGYGRKLDVFAQRSAALGHLAWQTSKLRRQHNAAASGHIVHQRAPVEQKRPGRAHSNSDSEGVTGSRGLTAVVVHGGLVITTIALVTDFCNACGKAVFYRCLFERPPL